MANRSSREQDCYTAVTALPTNLAYTFPEIRVPSFRRGDACCCSKRSCRAVAEPPQIGAAEAQVEILRRNACELSAFMSAPFDIALRARFATRQDCLLLWREAEPHLPHRATDPRGLVSGIREFSQSGIRINAGFFVLKRDIFKYLQLVLGSVIRGPQCD
jgi:hypothetical protein